MFKSILFIIGIFTFQFVILKKTDYKIVLLHHSTGGYLYNAGVPQWITNWNSANNYSLDISEKPYPASACYGWENYPYDWWNLWINPSTTCDNGNLNCECLDYMITNYDVISWKHCYPGSGIVADGVNQVDSNVKSLGNYKLQYRALRDMMDGYLEKLWIVWTLAPLCQTATNVESANRANEFVQWVKNEWLTEDGKSHPNIVIHQFFDCVGELTSGGNAQQYTLKQECGGGTGCSDSHPNSACNDVCAPIFSKLVVDSIQSYFENAVSNLNCNYLLIIMLVSFLFGYL